VKALALSLFIAACHAPARTEAQMEKTVAFQELYSGGGAVAGRTESLIVVHSEEAWRRIAPSLQAQRDLAGLRFEWARSVALVIQAPPAGSSAYAFHIASVRAKPAETEVRIELQPVNKGPGPWIGAPILNPSLLVAEADQAVFGGQIRLVLPDVSPAVIKVAHER
jgi:hypothetical protein